MKRVSIATIVMVFIALAFTACKCEKKGDAAAAAAAGGENSLVEDGKSKLDSLGNFIWDTGSEKEFELPDGTKITAGEKSTEYVLFDRLSGDFAVSDSVKSGDWFTFTNVQFETGSANIAESSKNQLDNVVKILNAFPTGSVKIGGYTDNTGADEVNVKVSTERANAVQKYLTDAGVPAESVAAEGFGAKYFLCEANDTDECKAQNRRVDLRITKK